MRRAVHGWASALCLIVIAVPAAAALRQSGTVAEGVYTREQADRGRKSYTLYCESCHAADLGGTNSGDSGAPPLRREGFMEGSHAFGLFTKIRETMPLDAPGSLSTSEYVDILAYIFRENGFPAGPKRLTSDAEQLRNIRIVRVAASRP
ncbi:MAG: c-type cytochrome [Acidobacteria bacterium]|nr:c-type cytochrome [Acidobacteriota bacterium]